MTQEEARDALLVALLARGNTYRKAAELAGVSRSTVDRRMADPAFAKRVADERAESSDRVVARLSSLAHVAVDALDALLRDSAADGIRLRAAQTVLSSAIERPTARVRLVNDEEVNQQIEELLSELLP